MKRSPQTYLFISILMLVSISLSLRNGWKNTLSWDAFGYQSYYSILFGGAEDLSHFEKINASYQSSSTIYQFVQTDSSFIPKYTIGWAIMYSPFVLAGHLAAKVSGTPSDFYSKPYQVSIYIGSIVFLTFAWIFTWLSLKTLFNPSKALLGIIITALGTSYLFYSYNDLSMNHHVQFFLVSLFVYLSIRYSHQRKKRYLLFLGVILGMIGLVRLPDLLIGIFPLLYWREQRQLKELFKVSHLKYTALALVLFFTTLGAQLLFWKVNTGSWIVDSYANNPGEGLDLSTPSVGSFLFDYKSGVFLFFPVYLLSVLGMFLFIKKQKNLFLPILITTTLFLYVAGSWSAYWYAPRAVLDILPFWAIGFTGFLSNINFRTIKIGAVAICCLFNSFKTWQISSGILPQLHSTEDSFWKSFFSTTSPEGKDTLLFRPRKDDFNSGEFQNWKNIYEHDFEVTRYFEPHLNLYNEKQFMNEIVIPGDSIQNTHDLMVNYSILTRESKSSIPNNLLLYLFIKHEGQVYHWRSLNVKSNSIDNKTNWYHYLPIPRSSSDTYYFGLWLNQKKDSVNIQQVQVVLRSRR